MRAAVIGIGSNSLRLLVADIKNGQYDAILRAREGLRVFASLNQRLEISADMIRLACNSVQQMATTARRRGAENVRLFATSAVRDARNGEELARALLAATGLALDICSGEREAKLSFIGATNDVWSGMIDIGGGSTEIAIGQGDSIAFAVSLQAGAVRLFRQMPADDAAGAARVTEAAAAMLRPYLPAIGDIKTPTEWVGVGGTATAAATCIQHTDWKRHEAIRNFIAERGEMKRVMETLAGMTPDRRRSLGSVPPDRADIIVHGFAILLGCMDALRIERIRISECSNLDGYLKSTAMAGSG